MKIQQFTESDIKEAALLAYPVWGEGHSANGNGYEFGLLMCEYIVRYGWYGSPYAFKVVENGKMVGCLFAGRIDQSNDYNNWLDSILPHLNSRQKEEALSLKEYFVNTSPKVSKLMNKDEDLYLSFFISTKKGCGKLLLAEAIELAKSEGYKRFYLWTDSSCNHTYYSHNAFELVDKFKSNEWASNNSDYLTYIYKKTIS